MPLTTGENLGPYRIMEKLGQGGMATVYKAYQASLDRYVAIKVLHPDLTEDPTFTARFQREARLVAKLDHPNIVPVYDFAEHNGYPYIVMKFIEGETLKARLRRTPLTSEEITRIVEAVGSALAYAHQEGVLHRDIKPSNVLLGKDGRIYLADFGLARIAQSGASTLSTDAILGTPQYISPEQAVGKSDLDERTDIYSFGVMLYELVVGQVPFNADTPFSIIYDHIYAPLPLPRSLNPSLTESVERVLLKALAKERADRYATVSEMVAAFQSAWGTSEASMKVGDEKLTAESTPAAEAERGEARPGLERAAQGAKEAASGKIPKARPIVWMFILGGAALAVCCVFAGAALLPGVFSWVMPAFQQPSPTQTMTPSFTFCSGEQTWLTRGYFPKQEIEHCWKQEHYITDVTYSNGEWTLVMTKPVEFTAQVYFVEPEFPQTKIREYWDQGYDITSVSYANGEWVVVLSAGAGFTNQIYFSGASFPDADIQKYWDEGYSITSAGYGSAGWYIVMSKGSVLKNQVYFTEAAFPESRIRNYWNSDYYITSVAYGNGIWAVVMSTGPSFSNQYYYKKESFPEGGIKEDWEDDFFITTLTYGDSLWIVVMSKP